MIPNVIHFVFGFKEDFGDKPFSFIHYLAIKSAYETNKPDAIKFHYKYEPTGEWWEKSKEYLTLVKVEPRTTIFGNPLLHYAHQSDVARLEILIKEGGIYLDMDVLCLNSFAPLRKYNCVMGMEEDFGLCNAVMLAEANSPFMKTWYEEYRNFRSKGRDEFWGEHSIKVPWAIAQKHPKMIHIEDKFSFFWPYYQGGLITLWDRPKLGWLDEYLLNIKKWFLLNFIKGSYCVHLWEQIWWEPHLKAVNPDYIVHSNSNFAKLYRRIINNSKNKSQRKFILFRPLMKKMINLYLPGLTKGK